MLSGLWIEFQRRSSKIWKIQTDYMKSVSKSEVIYSESSVALTRVSCDSVQWFSEEDPENSEATNRASNEIDDRILQ